MNPLKQLEACGQSPWLDYLKRSLIEKGDLRRLIERDGLKGVTSNPSIFEKAIGQTDEYTDAMRQFQAQADHGISAIYEHLAIADIRAAADLLRPVFDGTRGRDGYISLECSPYLANDTEGMVEEALRLWAAVERPNLMVKVPATPAGIPAIRRLIGRGLNINVTLLFSVNAYQQVAEAYLSGLEDLARKGGDIAKIGSVASIFVSRVDTAIDKRLDKLADKRAADRFRGKVAIANAKCAYAHYQAVFSGPRWEALAAEGAKTQRLLWASTGTKNPAFKDTMYVEALIGRDTVDTIPPATMDAFRDHGAVTPDAIEQDLPEAHALLAALEQQGISLDEVTEELVKDGVQQFADAFDALLGAIARQRRTLLDGEPPRLEIAPASAEMKTAFAAEMELWRKDGRIRRLWAGDKSPWWGADKDKWVGLVPAAAMGLDATRLLETVLPMERACGPDVPPVENPGVQLGVAMGVAATRFGRDKVTIVAAPEIADLGIWLARFLAESTGKQGRGLSPLAGEPLFPPEHYANDRFFAYLMLDGHSDVLQQDAVAALERAGHPVARIRVKDIWHIGQEFFRWAIAIRVADVIIGVDPFDQRRVAAPYKEAVATQGIRR